MTLEELLMTLKDRSDELNGRDLDNLQPRQQAYVQGQLDELHRTIAIIKEHKEEMEADEAELRALDREGAE